MKARLLWLGMAAASAVLTASCQAQTEAGATATPDSKPAAAAREIIGLTMSAPYARGKIPVVFIHGLWMTTAAWDQMIAEFRSDTGLNDRFQFWTFGYATGDPIPYAALLMRQSLTEARTRFDPERTDETWDRMVLVGHSMGGLLAKMMVVATGDQLWRVVSPHQVEDLQGDKGDVAALTQALLFTPRPEVRRVVFIATPHRGSKVDSGSIHRIGNRLVRSNPFPLGVHRRLSERNDPSFFSPYFQRGLPTSVEELRVNGPFLTGLARLPITPGVQAHSIIAVRPESPPDAPTDGLVMVESARLAGVASEKIVRCPHVLCLEDPDVFAEVRRILGEHPAPR